MQMLTFGVCKFLHWALGIANHDTFQSDKSLAVKFNIAINPVFSQIYGHLNYLPYLY